MTNRKNQQNILELPALQKWINEYGEVNYIKLNESKEFWEQLEIIENYDLKNKNQGEKLAFWLNVYNFITIKSVLFELKKNPNWKGNLSLVSKLRFFILRKHKIAGGRFNLNSIEQKKIRKGFKDPRIHFAINCGSSSCPYLPNQLFTSGNLEKTLDGLTKFFINSTENVCYDEKSNLLYLNKIFSWYSKDFAIEGGIKNFIAKYWKGSIDKLEDSKIYFKKYLWQLNTQ